MMKEIGKKIFGINPFSSNGFILGFSVLSAVIIWFFMSFTEVSEETPRQIAEIPIAIRMSEKAQADGLAIFGQSQQTVDVSVTGNASVINRLTADDFIAEATFDPSSTKVTGASMQSEVLKLRVQKAQSLKDFEIVLVEPDEITVEYDRVKKTTLQIENEIKYQLDSGFYVSAPAFSEADVILTGPESIINKIRRAAVPYEIGGTLKQDVAFKSNIVLYDQDNAVLSEPNRSKLTFSTDEISVSISVLPKKTVPITLNYINRPEGFADSRISVSHPTIEIAGTAEKLATVDEFLVQTPIDFADITAANRVFDLEVPVVADIRNVSNIETVQVSFNLNGYQEAKLSTSNITLTNVPVGLTPELVTKSLLVTAFGSEAQISKLTGDAIYATADLSNVTTLTGSVEVPVTVRINGANSCWVVGKSYVVTVNMDAQAAAANMIMDEDGSDESAAGSTARGNE